MGLCPFAMRRRKAKQISKIGTPRIRNGTANEIIAYILNRPVTDNVASMKPRNVAPVSPIKILAGFILYGKKPRHAPKSAERMIATFVSATISAMTVSAAVEMADTPAARPSRPSIKLTAFVMATIQMIVTG